MVNLGDLVGFSLTVTIRYKKERQGWKARFRPLQREVDFHSEIRIARLPNRTPYKLKGWRFFSWPSIKDRSIQNPSGNYNQQSIFEKCSFRSDQQPPHGFRVPRSTRNSCFSVHEAEAAFLEHFLAVTAWSLKGSSIECHEKKRQPFSLSGVPFGSHAILISGWKSA